MSNPAWSKLHQLIGLLEQRALAMPSDLKDELREGLEFVLNEIKPPKRKRSTPKTQLEQAGPGTGLIRPVKGESTVAVPRKPQGFGHGQI